MIAARAHWASFGESTFVFGIWLLYGVHRWLGRWPFRLCLLPVVGLHWLLRSTLRRASLEYLERVETARGAIGHAPGRLDSLRHFVRFAETLLDKLLAVSGRYPFNEVRIEGCEPIYQYLSGGRGAVIVTAHLGCLELSRALAERGGAPRLNILVHTRHAEQFNRILRRLSPRHEVCLIEVMDVDAATAMRLAACVEAGELVVIAGDRVPINSTRTAEASFLDHSARFPVGPYVIAALLHCPLYFLCCIRENDRYCVHAERLAERVHLPRATRDVALRGYAQTYADVLARMVARAPYDWFNFFPFWDQGNVETST